MRALLDSNVIIAGLAQGHLHHPDSAALLARSEHLAVSVHSLSEAYNHLTRPGRPGMGYPPIEVANALDALHRQLSCLVLSVDETLAAIKTFATFGGVGARLYDRLIGQVAVANRIPTLITWNTRHFLPLFPRLRIVTPPEFMETA